MIASDDITCAPCEAPSAIYVTTVLSPALAVRFEVLIARWRCLNPAMDDNLITDVVFSAGLNAAEQFIAQFPEQA